MTGSTQGIGQGMIRALASAGAGRVTKRCPSIDRPRNDVVVSVFSHVDLDLDPRPRTSTSTSSLFSPFSFLSFFLNRRRHARPHGHQRCRQGHRRPREGVWRPRALLERRRDKTGRDPSDDQGDAAAIWAPSTSCATTSASSTSRAWWTFPRTSKRRKRKRRKRKERGNVSFKKASHHLLHLNL